MAMRLGQEKSDTGRKDDGSRIWEGMKGKFAATALLVAAGCAPEHVFQPTTPQFPTQSAASAQAAETQPQEPFASFVLQSGRTSAGQIEVGLDRVAIDGRVHIRAAANVTGKNLSYMWFFYQESCEQQYLLNPRYTEGGQPRFIGIVMRGAMLTDGTSGDFVVRIQGNATAPVGVGELSPVSENDGSVQPGNVVLRLVEGSLVPSRDRRFMDSIADASLRSSSPTAAVEEFGPTSVVVAVLEKMAAATGPITNTTRTMTPHHE